MFPPEIKRGPSGERQELQGTRVEKGGRRKSGKKKRTANVSDSSSPFNESTQQIPNGKINSEGIEQGNGKGEGKRNRIREDERHPEEESF